MNLAGRPFVLVGIFLLAATALACTPTEEGLNSEPWAAPLAPTTAAFPTLQPAADLPTAGGGSHHSPHRSPADGLSRKHGANRSQRRG